MTSHLPYEIPFQQELTDILNEQLYTSQHLMYLQQAEIAKTEANAIIHNLQQYLSKNPPQGMKFTDYLKGLSEQLVFIQEVSKTYGGKAPQHYYNQVMQQAKKVLGNRGISSLERELWFATTSIKKPNVQPIEYTFPDLPSYVYGPN
jgi:hypothetical protein